MSWKIRHEGSPRVIDNLTLEQIVEGLQDGHWEPTDEVLGPGDTAWVAIESHPALAEVAADLEPPPAAGHGDETTLDMNPLIDVCLVLLVFFILTTSYAALQKHFEAPTISKDKRVPVLKKEQVAENMIRVTARQEKGGPVVLVEDKPVSLDRLQAELKAFARATKKSTLLLDHDDNVTQDVVLQIMDAAKGAGFDRIADVLPGPPGASGTP